MVKVLGFNSNPPPNRLPIAQSKATHFFSPNTSLSASSSTNPTSIISNQLDSSSSQKSSNNDDEKLIEEETLRLFEPWKHNPMGFAVDVVFSYFTYFITYTLLKYIRPKKYDLQIKDRIEKQAKPELEIKSELEDFKNTLSKMADNDPVVADKYWDFFDKHLNQNSEKTEENAPDKVFKSLYKLIYGTHRRLLLGTTIGVMSLVRAMAINPNMPLPLMLFILFGPLITNISFDKADSIRRQTENSSIPMKEWRLSESWRKGELNNFIYKIAAKCAKRSQEILEFVVFYAHSFISALLPFIPAPGNKAASVMNYDDSSSMQSSLNSKTIDPPELSFEGVVTFAIALFCSFSSRFFRDFLEDGLPVKKNQNPVYDFIGKLGFVKKLREENKKLKEGPVKGWLKEDKEHRGLGYLAQFSLIKTANKFATDIALFSLMGIGLLKVSYFFKHLFKIHRKKKDHGDDDFKYVPSETYTGKNNIVGFSRTKDSANA